MKKLELKQMEAVEGGKMSCSGYQNKVMAVAGAVTLLVGATGPIGAIIAGPTAVGVTVYSLVCAFQ